MVNRMRKSIKLSLVIVLILIAVCTLVVVLHPLKDQLSASSNSSGSGLVSSSLSSSAGSSLSAGSQIESGDSAGISASSESSIDLSSDLTTADQPDTPDLNFETSGSSYDDIMINVLTCILRQDMTTLSSYVGSQGLRLSPTGYAMDSDVILSASELESFFSLGSMTYGTYPGSGEAIQCTPDEYYDKFISPAGFDYAASMVRYNDANDLAALNGLVSNPKTISYDYAPNVMEWMRLILVYTSEGSGDVLCGIIYQDMTTN